MANYTLKSSDLFRRIVVKKNTRTGYERIFEINPTSITETEKALSKEYRRISSIAPNQHIPVYVLFVATGKTDIDLILNTGKVIKVRNWQKQVQPINTNRSVHSLKHEIFPKDLFDTKPQVFVQDDNIIIFKDKHFGEVLYNPKLDTLSATYEYISNPDKKGHRLALITTDREESRRLEYINSSFHPVCPYFYKSINNPHIMDIAGSRELICDLVKGNLEYYFLNENHNPCSNKYLDINTRNNQIIATTKDGKKVILNSLAQEVSPKFVNITAVMGDNFILQLEPNPNSLVAYNTESCTVSKIDANPSNNEKNNAENVKNKKDFYTNTAPSSTEAEDNDGLENINN